MIYMGLLTVLIKRLETGIKDLKETHNTDRNGTNNASRLRDADDDIDIIFPKRVKIECSPPRFMPVSELQPNFFVVSELQHLYPNSIFHCSETLIRRQHQRVVVLFTIRPAIVHRVH